MRTRAASSTRRSGAAAEARLAPRRLGAACCMRARVCARARARACYPHAASLPLAACGVRVACVRARGRSMADTVLHAIKALQAILDDAKESVHGGPHLRLCNAGKAG